MVEEVLLPETAAKRCVDASCRIGFGPRDDVRERSAPQTEKPMYVVGHDDECVGVAELGDVARPQRADDAPGAPKITQQGLTIYGGKVDVISLSNQAQPPRAEPVALMDRAHQTLVGATPVAQGSGESTTSWGRQQSVRMGWIRLRLAFIHPARPGSRLPCPYAAIIDTWNLPLT